MPAPLTPLRIVMGVLCVFFAWHLGRSLWARLHGGAANSVLMRWGLRTGVTALGAAWGGIDPLGIVMLSLAALSGGLGYAALRRPARHDRDLTDVMFPRG